MDNNRQDAPYDVFKQRGFYETACSTSTVYSYAYVHLCLVGHLCTCYNIMLIHVLLKVILYPCTFKPYGKYFISTSYALSLISNLQNNLVFAETSIGQAAGHGHKEGQVINICRLQTLFCCPKGF